MSHSISGAAAGLALAHCFPGALNIEGPRDAFAFATVVAGFSLLPDLDHPQSTATRRFEWASWVACRIVRPLSALAFRLTRTRKDRGEGKHRGLTHTWLCAAVLGVGATAAVDQWGPPAVWAIVFIAAALVVKGMDAVIPGPPSLAAGALYTGALVGVPLAEVTPGPLARLLPVTGGAPWLGLAVALGMAVHTIGDAATESGAPILAPLAIRGRRWAPLGPPKPLRFKTGGPVELGLLGTFTATAAVLAVLTVPGGQQLLSRAWVALHAASAAAADGGRRRLALDTYTDALTSTPPLLVDAASTPTRAARAEGA